jgi:hypothetical protein
VIAWLALVLAFVLPAVLSWQRWTDPLVDVGRQPYVAWRILEGDRLYLDIAHVFGPLAAHVQAAVMALSGVSLASLAGFHLFLIACFALQLRGFFGWLGGACAGVGAAMSFLLLCAFPQYIFQANYNFVTPYSADLVYGLMLAMLCLSLVLRCGAGTAAPWRWVAAGACLGLVVLGKPEVCVALLAALLVAMLRAPQGARNCCSGALRSQRCCSPFSRSCPRRVLPAPCTRCSPPLRPSAAWVPRARRSTAG